MDGKFLVEKCDDKGHCRECGKTTKVGSTIYLIQIPDFGTEAYYYFCSEKCLREYKSLTNLQ